MKKSTYDDVDDDDDGDDKREIRQNRAKTSSIDSDEDFFLFFLFLMVRRKSMSQNCIFLDVPKPEKFDAAIYNAGLALRRLSRRGSALRLGPRHRRPSATEAGADKRCHATETTFQLARGDR